MAGLLSGCSQTIAATVPESTVSSAETTLETKQLEADRLVNHMSENERRSVSAGPLTIFEEPWK